MTNEIDNVVFDLGGVLVDLDMARVREAFREIGMPRMADLMDPCYPAEVNERMERGDLDFHEACEEMRRIDGRPEVTDAQIHWVYDEFLARIDPEKLRQIDRLRAAGIRTYVLSNTTPPPSKSSATASPPSASRWRPISTASSSPTACAN